MQINFTKLYRFWHLLTMLSVFGILITFFTGYDGEHNSWNNTLLNMHTIFTFTLLGAVCTRLYMAFSKINDVPMMHLIRAKNLSQALVAFGYIAMCTALLITLGSELYILSSEVHSKTLIHELRNVTQPVFALMVVTHLLYVIYTNIIKKSSVSLSKLLKAAQSS